MAAGLAQVIEWADGRARRLERAIVLQGTSRYREEGVRLLARLVSDLGAHGAAYGWTDALAPDRLVPVHAVSTLPESRWLLGLDDSSAHLVDRDGSTAWWLLVRGAAAPGPERSDPLLSRALGWFADARDRDCPKSHGAVSPERGAAFVGYLDALRAVGFEIGKASDVPALRLAVGAEVVGLPEATRPAAREVVKSLADGAALGDALLRLGGELDVAGALPEAVSVLSIAYELAVRRVDTRLAIDAARSLGRGYRKLAAWSTAFRWYRLAQRIAELEQDHGRLAIALDGEGNTHRERGAFPKARECYERAWRAAVTSGDGVAVGSTGHSMMVVEREAGRLDSAARYGWTAIQAQPHPELRARLFVELGTLLLEFGDVTVARSAYRLAAAATVDVEIRALAIDGIAYSDALLGDWRAYERNRRRARREARSATAQFRAQMGYFRARSLLVRGRRAAAMRVLAATERHARAIGAATWAVKAGELSDALARREPPPPVPTREAPSEVRQGLLELAEVGA